MDQSDKQIYWQIRKETQKIHTEKIYWKSDKQIYRTGDNKNVCIMTDWSSERQTKWSNKLNKHI